MIVGIRYDNGAAIVIYERHVFFNYAKSTPDPVGRERHDTHRHVI